MKYARRLILVLVVAGLTVTSSSCAQQDQGTFRYTQQDREQVKETVKQSTEQLGQLAKDIKSFYNDITEVARESGFYEEFARGNDPGMGAFDVYVSEKNMAIVLDLAGVDKRELKVTLKDATILEVSGERPVIFNDPGYELKRGGRQVGQFKKIIELPHKAKGKTFKADYENGILVVTIPREEDQDEVVNIPVS